MLDDQYLEDVARRVSKDGFDCDTDDLLRWCRALLPECQELRQQLRSRTVQQAVPDRFELPLDFDVADHELAKALGVMPDVWWDPHLKWVFWSNNPVSTFLCNTIEGLVQLGALLVDEDCRYRWNLDFHYKEAAEQDCPEEDCDWVIGDGEPA